MSEFRFWRNSCRHLRISPPYGHCPAHSHLDSNAYVHANAYTDGYPYTDAYTNAYTLQMS
ncbi:MAG: hypothetical protein JXB35_03095 [Anaerolineae bacterium]|nr:hypothetical protein [Anaerolineae bacterium]